MMRPFLIAAVLTLLLAPAPLWGQTADITPNADVGTPGSAEAAEDFAAPKSNPRLWGDVEFLLWRIKGANLPPLATTGPSSDPLPGALSSAATKVLFGGSGLDFQDRSGGRFALGYWLDDDQQWGLSGTYTFLAGRSMGYSISSPGNPIIAVPFTNVATGAADSSLVSFPGVMSGRIVVEAPTFLQSVEANATAMLWRGPTMQLQGFAGFRYAGLNEGLHLDQISLIDLAPQYLGLVPNNGNTITVHDSFDTRNSFYGAQLGLTSTFEYKRLSLMITTQVAIGASNEVVNIHGDTINTMPATVTNGGLFALSSNSGQFSRDRFAVVPELNISLGFQLTDQVRLVVGYSFLYWSSVARPGDQIDPAINPNLTPTSNTYGTAGGPNRPAFAFHATDFFAYGVNLGMEIRY